MPLLIGFFCISNAGGNGSGSFKNGRNAFFGAPPRKTLLLSCKIAKKLILFCFFFSSFGPLSWGVRENIAACQNGGVFPVLPFYPKLNTIFVSWEGGTFLSTAVENLTNLLWLVSLAMGCMVLWNETSLRSFNWRMRDQDVGESKSNWNLGWDFFWGGLQFGHGSQDGDYK